MPRLQLKRDTPVKPNPLWTWISDQLSRVRLMTDAEKAMFTERIRMLQERLVPESRSREFEAMKQGDLAGLRNPPSREEQAEIIQKTAEAMPLAYHGTPHEWAGAKPDISKVGTGQGAQSYGHGLYFAENPEVAQSYQAALATDVKVRGQSISSLLSTPEMPLKSLDRVALQSIQLTNAQNTLNYVDDLIKQGKQPKALREVTQQWLNDVESTRGGALYQVNIPDEHVAKMLDWDKPLSEQPEVLNVLKQRLKMFSFGGPPRIPKSTSKALELMQQDPTVVKEIPLPDLKDMTGKDVYKMIADLMAPHTEDFGYIGPDRINEAYRIASNKLKALGIPGIKYLDQGSRAARKGTRNFVVFDPDIITEVKKK